MPHFHSNTDNAVFVAAAKGDAALLRAAFEDGGQADSSPVVDWSKNNGRRSGLELHIPAAVALYFGHLECARIAAAHTSPRIIAANGPLRQEILRGLIQGDRSALMAIEDGMIDRQKLDEAEQRLLRSAAHGDLLALSKAMLDGADPQACDARGYDALMLAARHGHARCIEALVAMGYARPLRKLPDGETALNLALMNDMVARDAKCEVAEVLAPISDCQSFRFPSGQTLLMQCAAAGDLRSVIALLPRSDPDAKDNSGQTALGHLVDLAPGPTEGRLLVEALWPATDTKALNRRGQTLAEELLGTSIAELILPMVARDEAAALHACVPNHAPSFKPPRI